MSVLVLPERRDITATVPSGRGIVNAQFGAPSGAGTYEAFLLNIVSDGQGLTSPEDPSRDWIFLENPGMDLWGRKPGSANVSVLGMGTSPLSYAYGV
jgi:hypothetical protein